MGYRRRRNHRNYGSHRRRNYFFPRRYYRHSAEDGLIALLIVIVINLVAMPFVGIGYLTSGVESEKTKGTIMLIAGIIIWCYIILKMIR